MKEVTAFKTSDGRLFETEENAKAHENTLSKVKAFSIYTGPDLTEGRHGPKFQGYLLVHANGSHELFAEDWCFKNFNNRVAFVMGVFGSNAIIEKWQFKKVDLHVVSDGEVIDRIEENFVSKLWK